MLYPFSLSYVPLASRPRHRKGPELREAQRRSLMLAASSSKQRTRWLESLARKIGSAQPLGATQRLRELCVSRLRPSSMLGEQLGAA